MADVADGLVDPNEDFEGALAGAAGIELPGERSGGDEDTSIAAGLTGLTEEQPRDAEGRFTPAAPASSEETSPAEGPEEGQPAAEAAANPALAALLEQHGGDPEAALEALITERENAQSLIGRQGNQLGELRSELDQLKGYVEALGSQPEPRADLPLVNDDIVEGLESLQEQRGTRGMMDWVIENRPDLIETAEQVWAAEDPVMAAGFRARREAFQILGEREQAPAQVSDPVIESMRAERALGNTIDQARADLGISEQDWPAVRDHITAVFEDENTPSLIKNAVVSTDPEQQLEGMKNLMQVARSRAAAAATADATTQATAAAAEQAADRKKAATVVTGALRPSGVAQPAPGEQTSEERKSAFKEALLKTEVTSVADGLTGLS